MDNEHNLWKMWRLFDTKFNTQSGAGRRVKEIRIDAETLSERVQERDLFRLVTIWRIKETSAHDTGTGRGKIWFAGATDGREGGSDRAVKGTRSDVLGEKNE